MSRRDVHRNRGADPFPSNVSRKNGRAPVVRFLDAIDRARLTPMDVLLLLQIAEAEATVVDLADRLDRRAADVRRATGNLVARGLVRPRAHRTLPWGVVFTVTASGLDVLAGLDVPSSFAGPRDGNGRRHPRRDPHRRLTADRGASG